MKGNEPLAIDPLYMDLIKLPIHSKEYQLCLEKIRRLEIGECTLGLNLSLEPAYAPKDFVDMRISIS